MNGTICLNCGVAPIDILPSFLVFTIFFLLVAAIGLIVYFKKLVRIERASREEWGVSYIQKCREIGVKKEFIDKIKRLAWLQVWHRKYWFLLPIALLFATALISQSPPLSMASYFKWSLFGLVCQFIAGVMFVKSSIKDPYQIALECTTRYGYNLDSVKANLDTTFFISIGWLFLFVGFMSQLLALVLEIIFSFL